MAVLSLFFWQQFAAAPAYAGVGGATGTVTIFNSTAAVVNGILVASREDTIADPDGVTNASYAWGWYSGGRVIEGETSEGYRVLATDIGNEIYAVVHFVDNAGNPEQLRSEAVGPVPVRDNKEATGAIEVSVGGAA